MSEQPTASATPSRGGKILGVPRRTFFIIVGAGLAAGLAFYWYKNFKAAKTGAATSTTGTSTTGTDFAGQLSTLQAELQALQQEQAGATVGGGGSSGGGGSWGGGGWSGGSGGDSGDSGSSTSGDSTGSAATSGGSTSTSGSTSGATSSGGTASGSSGTSGSSGGSTSSSGGGGGAAPAPSNGRVVTNSHGTVVLAWNGNGAAYWTIHITGPGPLNGRTNRVSGPQATYFGVQSGHNYETRITPYTANGTPGPVGGIDFKAN